MNIPQFGGRNFKYIPNKNDIVDYLIGLVKKGDLIITFGAGDIWKERRKVY